jgi:hypothetical protein
MWNLPVEGLANGAPRVFGIFSDTANRRVVETSSCRSSNNTADKTESQEALTASQRNEMISF